MIIKIFIGTILLVFFVVMTAYRKMLGWLIGPLTVCLALGILFTIRPEVSDQIANLVGVGRGTDLIIYLYILGTNFIVLILFIKIRAMGRQITELTRFVAHSNAHFSESDRSINIKL